ncbi:hypothetical protein D3C71_1547700 [compost metagenome]
MPTPRGSLLRALFDLPKVLLPFGKVRAVSGDSFESGGRFGMDRLENSKILFEHFKQGQRSQSLIGLKNWTCHVIEAYVSTVRSLKELDDLRGEVVQALFYLRRVQPQVP